MFPVKVEGKKARLLGRFAKQSERLKLHRAGVELRDEVDQTLIRGFGTGFRVLVSGLSSVEGAGVGRIGSAT